MAGTIFLEGGKGTKCVLVIFSVQLTGAAGVKSKHVGKIDIYDRQSYVAIERSMVDKAYSYLKNGKIKGRTFSVWFFDSSTE